MEDQSPPKVTARLEGWILKNGIYGMWLEGRIYDDTKGRFQDGTYVHTSSIELEEAQNLQTGSVAKTRNSNYLLGEILTVELWEPLVYNDSYAIVGDYFISNPINSEKFPIDSLKEGDIIETIAGGNCPVATKIKLGKRFTS